MGFSSDDVGSSAGDSDWIQCNCVSSFSHAAYENFVRVIKFLRVSNLGENTLYDLCVTVEASPTFLKSKIWKLEKLHPGESHELGDLALNANSEYLRDLNEAERGKLRFVLQAQGKELAVLTKDIRVLARDEWGGAGCAELLAAFVTPNDPEVTRCLRKASQILSEAKMESSLEGYQSGDPARSFIQASAIWSAVTAEGLIYANPPRSFETSGQKIRRPDFILTEKLATCLDTTLLFASAFEQIGLNPVIVLQKTHAFVGFWLRKEEFGKPLTVDVSEIRKAIAADELVVIETTLVTKGKKNEFEHAIKLASAQLDEVNESDFVCVVDIKRARMANIRPLASHSESRDHREDEKSDAGLSPAPLAPAPAFESLAKEEVEIKPTTPKGRVDRWQRNLLDLSKRNRLLNFRNTKQTVPLMAPDISRMEDYLASGKKLKLVSSTQKDVVDGRDEELLKRVTGADALKDFVEEAWASKEVVAPCSDQELQRRLTNVYRSSKSDLAEGGSNTLFLAIGFLRWKDLGNETRTYKAPLLLLPIKLTRRSVKSTYQLSQHEDDVRFNSTLIQMLQQDFALDLSDFEKELPTDDSGIDVPLVLNQLRRRVRDVPGFEIVEEMAIATFSFAKYLMWKDLVDRLQQLERNRVVKHLINNPEKVYRESDRHSMPEENQVDTHFKPSELYHPLDADSSQLAAVMAAAKGHDFVLIGPPGTGKSQTIANMIAQCLAEKKTVLFVAEKTAALDVVYRRLKQHGLGNCCVELHSNKTERRIFLKQLQNCWENRTTSNNNVWEKLSTRLEARRDELNGYVAALHSKYENGMSAFDGMGITTLNQATKEPRIDWDDSVKHDVPEFQRLLDTVRELDLAFAQIEHADGLQYVHQARWSLEWETEIVGLAEKLTSLTPKTRSAAIELTNELGIDGGLVKSIEDLDCLKDLCVSLVETADFETKLLFHKQVKQLPAILNDLKSEAEKGRDARARLEGRFDFETILEIPVEELETQWREAAAKFWPLSVWSKGRVNRLLKTYSLGESVDAASDLKNIAAYQTTIKALKENSLEQYTKAWQGIETDFLNLKALVERALDLRNAMLQTGVRFDALKVLSSRLSPILKTRGADHSVYSKASEFLDDFASWFSAVEQFKKIAGLNIAQRFSIDIFDETEAFSTGVISNRRLLKKWTHWCEVKEQAKGLKLESVIDWLESNGGAGSDDIVDRFRIVYAHWWLRGVIDRDPTLRGFQKHIHEDAIRKFCEYDKQSRNIAHKEVLKSCSHSLPKPDEVPRKSELGKLRHQINLKRPSKSIRALIEDMPEKFSQLAPCVLMSPISIAQYLPADHSEFDVVIFDEASQIPTWDAIGAIARGKQAIIVGDPKQLPPTNFFGRNMNDNDDETTEEYEKDLESILDETKASGLPVLQLNWHYRSRHESLIAFSNRQYYKNRLITFPAADDNELGVRFVHVKNAPYDRGGSRTNRTEAKMIVSELVRRMKIELERLPEKRLTFGVVTFNQTQQSLIQDLLDQEQVEDSTLEWYFSEDRIEPTVVKNLENVQGDERDVMVFSVTYGKDSAGKFYRNFGALNRDGGERRLNVAVTRSRRLLLVYSSMKGEDLDVTGLKAQGVNDLKKFLEYAEHGEDVLKSDILGSVGEIASPFEEAVFDALKQKGWDVVPQVGVSGFRIDLAIRHPDHPGKYLAGVECDGATYHSSVSARDRDKTRELVLRGLGWEIIRIWSPDWWYSQTDALESVDSELSSLLEKSRMQAVNEDGPSIDLETNALESKDDAEADIDEIVKSHIEKADLFPENPIVEEEKKYDPDEVYREFDISIWSPSPEEFFNTAYLSALEVMVKDLVQAEGPIHEDVIAKKIARAHGWMRTGKKIRTRVKSALRNFKSTKEATGKSYWAVDNPPETIPFRHSVNASEQRPIDEISIAEIR
ncbi:MAG: DUF3320 domain-containing protein, partial [Planctomycetaceae bacterium]|nr:DUF3320 domain-containing protein [Planctomycetaceae bacterium]